MWIVDFLPSSWSMMGVSHQPVFMGDCLTIAACVLACLPDEYVSFCVPGAIEADTA